MRLSAFALFVALGVSTLTAPVRAQVIAPGLDNDLNINFDRAFANITNPFLSDSIKLNYQITLLEKMTQRQAELAKISEAFAALGIPYNEPAPSYTLCGQLPPNVPCLRHYPGLYQSLVNERRQHYAEIELERAITSGVVTEQVAAIDPALAERAKKEREAAAKRAEEIRLEREAAERRSRYSWSEVSCLVGNCTGVVTGAGGFRATVRDGSRLPDNSVVKSISRFGITMIIDGETIALRPDPANNAGAAPIAALDLSSMNTNDPRTVRIVNSGDSVSNAPASIQAQPVSTVGAANSAPSPMTPADMMGDTAGVVSSGGVDNAGTGIAASGGDTGPGGVTTVAPTLGPSGLF